jgi:hypothetical protein
MKHNSLTICVTAFTIVYFGVVTSGCSAYSWHDLVVTRFIPAGETLILDVEDRKYEAPLADPPKETLLRTLTLSYQTDAPDKSISRLVRYGPVSFANGVRSSCSSTSILRVNGTDPMDDQIGIVHVGMGSSPWAAEVLHAEQKDRHWRTVFQRQWPHATSMPFIVTTDGHYLGLFESRGILDTTSLKYQQDDTSAALLRIASGTQIGGEGCFTFSRHLRYLIVRIGIVGADKVTAARIVGESNLVLRDDNPMSTEHFLIVYDSLNLNRPFALSVTKKGEQLIGLDEMDDGRLACLWERHVENDAWQYSIRDRNFAVMAQITITNHLLGGDQMVGLQNAILDANARRVLIGRSYVLASYKRREPIKFIYWDYDHKVLRQVSVDLWGSLPAIQQ